MVVRELIGLLKIKTDKKSMKNAQSGMSKLTKIVGTAAAAFAAFKLTSWLKGVADEVAQVGDTFDKMAKRTGVSAQALQRWDHAAQLSGASIQEVEKSLLKLQKAQVEAQDGTVTYSDEFERLGVEVTNTDGSFKDTGELMLEMADAMNELPSDAERTAVAMTLMGRGGASLIPMFKEGSAGIREMMGEMDDLGVVMGKDLVQASAENVDTMRRFDMVIRGVKLAIGNELLPVMTETVKKVIEWWKANKEVVSVKIKEYLQEAIKAIQMLGEKLGWVADNWGWLKPALKTIGGVAVAIMGIAAALKIWAAGTAVVTALQWLLNAAIYANPMVLIIGAGIVAIGALIAIVILVIEYWDEIVEGIKAAGSAIADFGVAAGEALSDAWDAAVEFFTGIINYIDELFGYSKVFNAVFGGINSLFGGGDTDDTTNKGLPGTPQGASLVAGRSNTSVSQRNDVNIKIDGAGGSPKEIGAEVSRQMQSVFDDQYSKAAQNLVPEAT